MLTKYWVVIATAVTVSLIAALSIGYVMMQPPMVGTLVMEVHDAPCSDCAHVWVGFQSVSVHASNASGGGWATLNVSGTVIDLAALNGSALAKVIGVASLPPGHYEQIRLSVTNVTVELTNGTKLVAAVPSASSADVNGAFNVTAGATTTLSIDVDLASSLHVVQEGPVLAAIFTPNIGSVTVV